MRRGVFFRGRSESIESLTALDRDAHASSAMSDDVVDVDDLDRRVTQLFLLVADGLAGAIATLLNDDRVTARELMSADRNLDILSEDVERLAERALLGREYRDDEQARHLLLVIQIVPEIERSGDLVQHIAARASQGVGNALSAPARLLVEQMGEIGVTMWRSAAQAYAARDRTAAVGLRLVDDELDDLHVRLTQAMGAATMSVAAAIQLGLVARFLERMGDHAVNITRRFEDARVPAS